MSWDPYSALGVTRTASESEIKSAYRRLAKELHPDVKPGDAAAEARFKRVSAAFSLLGDSEKKARFDRGEIDADGNERATFHGGFGGAGQGGFGGGPGFQGRRPGAHPGAGGPDVFEDLFGNMFGQGGTGGGRGRGFGPSKGADIRYHLEIDFLEAVLGARKRVSVADNRSLELTIPAGVETGKTLRLKAQGEPGPMGGAPGDAMVEITVRSHPLYRREGDHLYIDLNISLAEAVEGGKVPVDTPSGKVALNVPAGSNSGTVLRLKGRGVQKKSSPGDLFAKLLVTLPDKIDSELKKFVANWGHRNDKIRD